MKRVLLLALVLLAAPGAAQFSIIDGGGGGGGGGTDYTANGAFYELWDFNEDGANAVCDGVVNGNDLTEQPTITHVTSGGGLVEGAQAFSNNNTDDGCSGSLTGAPTGSWTIGWRWYPTEGPTFNQVSLGTNSSSGNFVMRANTATGVDWRINNTNINDQHTYAVNTQYSVIVYYDGTDLTFWWNGGSGGSCSGSTYTSTLDPSDITSLEVGTSSSWGGIYDELFLTGQTFTQTDACNVYNDGIDGAGLP